MATPKSTIEAAPELTRLANPEIRAADPGVTWDGVETASGIDASLPKGLSGR